MYNGLKVVHGFAVMQPFLGLACFLSPWKFPAGSVGKSLHVDGNETGARIGHGFLSKKP
jgi:hypothetical protein